MTTIVAQILDRLDVVLKAHVLGGTNVYRDRVDPISRDECPCVNVLADADPSEPFSDNDDRHELLVDIKFHVRDAVPTPVAEAQHLAVHAAIVTDATLKTLAVSVRSLGGRYERDEADVTALVKSVQYRFIYLIPSNTL